ncbi:hypothetical protein RND71_036949 [Anisodus tanguticus]|uniref:BHLH domain-containing protein n=1 Tax=Anisodus tanguticus TaxID=243964 RepID=A0AAE1V0T5_9SOLA|nr:hypothetical protein RND71_036949 [Anisodus tanguticus]
MYGDSPALVSKKREEVFMESEFENRNQNNTSSLLRFRSAPTSFLENLTDEVFKNGNKRTNNLDGRLVSHNSLGKSMVNASQLPPPHPRQYSGTQDGGYKVVSSLEMDHQGQNKLGSNIMRQNSSPVGLFSHLNAQNGYAVGGYRMDNGANGDMVSSSSRLKSQLGILSRISEIENESSISVSLDDEKSGNGNLEAQFYNSGLPFASWSDASHFQETFTDHKRELDNEGKLFANDQIGQLGNRPPILLHHLSLPKTPAEVAALEKMLQLQDSVPCKIRAKRGCATHPRSIAERQTNTADMLDLAVEYIKDLQKKYKIARQTANAQLCRRQFPIKESDFLLYLEKG